MSKKILVTGADGLVGSRFIELFPNSIELFTPSFREFDITSPNTTLDFGNVSTVLHIAAHTDVSQAEIDGTDCWRVNYLGTQNLVNLFPKAHFIYISTNLVFSGLSSDPGPYTEKHPPEVDKSKVSFHGWSKSQAEKILPKSAAIVRICNPVRAAFPRKLDYLRKPLNLFIHGQLYPLFNDQQISITFIDTLCIALQKIIHERLTGTFHVSSLDTTTPHEIVEYLLKVHVPHTSINSVENKVRYPKYSALDSKWTTEQLKLPPQTSKQIVDELIKQGISV